MIYWRIWPQPAGAKLGMRDSQSDGPRVVGSEVVIITKNDDRITGTLVDLTAYSIRIKADNLESTIALDRIASLSFGNGGSASHAVPPNVAPGGDFARNAAPLLKSFQSFAERLRSLAPFHPLPRINLAQWKSKKRHRRP